MDPDPSSPTSPPAESHLDREHRLKLALEASGLGTWIWIPESNAIVWDEFMPKLFGLKPGVFSGKFDDFLKLVLIDDRSRVRSEMIGHRGRDTGYDSEYRVVWPCDGSVHFLRSRGRVYRDADGIAERMTGACWEVTDRKKVEAELAHEQHLLSVLLETMPEVIYFKDLESRFSRVSRALLRKSGLHDPSQMLGKTDFDFFSEEHARQAFDDERRIIDTGTPIVDIEEKETWPDSHETWVSTTKMPLRDPSGRIIGTFGLSRDVTARKHAEEQLAKYAEELKRKNNDLEEDLEMARELQNALLPQQYPSFPHSAAPKDSALRFSHFFNPTAAVSGDFFDILDLSDTMAGMFICDVMGHGVRAALVAAIVRALVEEQRATTGSPGEFLSKLNRALLGVLKQAQIPMFASAFYVVADLARGELRYANAGHPSPVYIQREADGGAKGHALNHCERGPVLGMFADAQYRTTCRPLSVDDRLLLFTDGLFEVEGENGDFYDQARLLDAVNRRLNLAADELCREILSEIRQFSASKTFADDVCIVTMQVDRLAVDGMT